MDHDWTHFKEKMLGLKGLAEIGFADIIGAVISAFFWFYLASLIEPNDYGEIHYFIGIATIVSYVSLLGTQETISVYTAKNIKIQSTLYLISLIGAFISSLIVIIIFSRIDTAFVIFGLTINVLAIGDLLGRRLYSTYSKFILIQKILMLILGITFYYLIGVEGILYALALSYAFFSLRIFKVIKESNIDFHLLKSKIGFTTNNYIVNLVSAFTAQVDKLIIAPLLGFALLGNYSLALQFITILLVFSNVIFKYLIAHDAAGIKNQKLKKMTVFMSIGIAVASIIGVPALIPIIFSKYVNAIEAIQIMSVAIVPYTISMIFTSKFLGLEKSKFVLAGNIIQLVTTVIGIIILGTMFDIVGIATAFVLAAIFQTVFLASMDRFILNSTN